MLILEASSVAFLCELGGSALSLLWVIEPKILFKSLSEPFLKRM
jgi:hypothetical protein